MIVYDLSAPVPVRVAEYPLFFPVPSTLHSYCNATSFVALVGLTVQADSEDRETVMVGDIQAVNREGLFIPLARANLPTFQARGGIALFLSGAAGEFGGQVLAPLYPLFNRGPGPAPQVEGGLLWVVEPFNPPRPGSSILAPLNYYLAGAAGVPNQ